MSDKSSGFIATPRTWASFEGYGRVLCCFRKFSMGDPRGIKTRGEKNHSKQPSFICARFKKTGRTSPNFRNHTHIANKDAAMQMPG